MNKQGAATHSQLARSALLFCNLRTCNSTNAARQSVTRRLAPVPGGFAARAACLPGVTMCGSRRRRLKRQLDSTIIHFVSIEYTVNNQASQAAVTQPYQERLDAVDRRLRHRRNCLRLIVLSNANVLFCTHLGLCMLPCASSAPRAMAVFGSRAPDFRICFRLTLARLGLLLRKRF